MAGKKKSVRASRKPASKDGGSSEPAIAQSEVDTVRRAPVAGQSVASLPVGAMLGDEYQISAVHSADGSSIVYQAEDLNLGIPVSIKEFIPPSATRRGADGSLALGGAENDADERESIERFIREARALVRFHHPNVVRAHRILECNNTAYIIMDFERAATLSSWLEGLGRLPTQAELDRITGRLLEALGVVHSAGVIHRDICPQNILIRSDLSPVLTGFGHAAISDAMKPGTATVMVHASDFLAPEIAAEDEALASFSSDLYGLAATLYFAMSGRMPPGGAGRLVNDTLVPAREIADDGYRSKFVEAIDAALAVKPEDRLRDVDGWLSVDTPVDPALVPAPERQQTARETLANSGSGTIASGSAQEAETQSAAFGSTQRIATRFLSSLDELPDPVTYAALVAARVHLPIAIVLAFLGVSLYGSGWSFKFSAILQVAAILFFWVGGWLELQQLRSDLPFLKASAIEPRTSAVTAKAALMAGCILGMLAMAPVFADAFLPRNANAPVQALSFIIGVPAVCMLVVATSATGITGAARWVFGLVNMLVVVFCVLIFGLYLYVLLVEHSGSLDAGPLANSYLFVLAPLAAGSLNVFAMLSRLKAIRERKKKLA